MFDFCRAEFEKEMGEGAEGNMDSLIAICFDILEHSDGLGTDEKDTVEDWKPFNEDIERLGILLQQYKPPSIEDYLARED